MNETTQVYFWEGSNEKGARIKGKDFGFNTEDLINKLHSQKIQPIKIVCKIQNKITKVKLFSQKKIKSKDIAGFAKAFANLISANIPLVTALEFMASDSEANNLSEIIKNIKNDVENGMALNLAFRKHPQYFDSFFCNLISVGEYSGTLDAILKILASYLEKNELQKKKIIKALFYPIVVFIVAIIVTSILLIFVVPQFKEMFANFGAALPAYTLFIINLADFIKSKGIVILIFFLMVFLIVRRAIKCYEILAQYFDKIKLKIPIFGKFKQKIIISRFAKILSIMFKSGIPILEALAITASICNNYVYETAVLAIKNKITKGSSMQSAMREVNLFPHKMLHFIAVGEESGRLDDMLAEIAKYYEEELNYTIDNLNNLLEPMIMLILGVMVGSVVIAMYLPIFKLGSVV